jgi:hypothetical protein
VLWALCDTPSVLIAATIAVNVYLNSFIIGSFMEDDSAFRIHSTFTPNPWADRFSWGGSSLR